MIRTFQQQYQHDWDWLWVSEDENGYIDKTGEKAVDYFGVADGAVNKLYSILDVTQTDDILTAVDDLNDFVFGVETAISLFQEINADYQTSYLYTISSPSVSGTTSQTVTIVVPQEKQNNLKNGVLTGIGAGVLTMIGITNIEELVGLPIIAAGVYEMIQSDNTMKAAADPDLNYTTPISVTPVDLPQLDQQPDSPLKEFAMQCKQTATDTEAYADTYDKYQGALISNDSVWEFKLQLECYNYTSQLTDDYQKENVLVVPALQYLQEQGFNPTQSDVESSMNNLSQNGFPPAAVQMFQEAGFSDHEINSIKNITLQNPYSLVVDYNQSIPYLINISQQQAQQLNNNFGSDLGILAPPSAQFSANVTSGNSPLTVAFTDDSTRNVTQWAWNFGDGATDTTENPVHTYTALGSYTVNLTAINSTTGSDTRTMYDYITVYPPPPVANFTANITYGQVPLTVSFTDTSTNSPTQWAWDFGDGGNASDQNPVYTYVNAGTYTVSLNATNAGGSNITTQIGFITVLPSIPVANFTASPTSGTVPLTVQFTDASTNSPTSWNWSFGDGNTSTLENPSYQYTYPGTFTVTLNATNAGGSNITTQTGFITVLSPSPVAKFTASPTSGTVPLTVQFTDMSTNSPTSWNWSFGDGNTSTLENPSYQYTSPGTYAVTLNATNAGGSNTITQTGFITVLPTPPVAKFTASPTSGTVPLTVQFTDTSTGSPTSWDWSFGDGNTSTLENPSYQYTYPGTYTVTLNVTNTGGSNTTTINNYINAQSAQTNPNQGVTVILKNSLGNGIPGATITYYANGWKSFGTTNSNGTASMNLQPGTYTFQMDYAGGYENLLQTVNATSIVTFQTTNVTAELLDGRGNLITSPNAGTVQYYANGWRTFGSTVEGLCSMELLPVSYTFQMTYQGMPNNLLQNVSQNPLVSFQTTQPIVTVQFVNSLGAPISGGSVTYYANGWKPFGTTNSNGMATMGTSSGILYLPDDLHWRIRKPAAECQQCLPDSNIQDCKCDG